MAVRIVNSRELLIPNNKLAPFVFETVMAMSSYLDPVYRQLCSMHWTRHHTAHCLTEVERLRH
jgi:hypothetical protein